MEFDLASLGNLEVTLRGVVTTVTKYEIDASSKGGALWLTKPNNEEKDTVLGDQIIKVNMPFEMFQHCKSEVEAGRFTFPGVFEVRASVTSGSGNKSGHKATSILQLARLTIKADSLVQTVDASSLPAVGVSSPPAAGQSAFNAADSAKDSKSKPSSS